MSVEETNKELSEFRRETAARYQHGNKLRLEAIRMLEKSGPILLSDRTWVSAKKLKKAYNYNLQNQKRVLNERGIPDTLGEPVV